jgi:hypothetical protein
MLYLSVKFPLQNKQGYLLMGMRNKDLLFWQFFCVVVPIFISSKVLLFPYVNRSKFGTLGVITTEVNDSFEVRVATTAGDEGFE